MRAIISMYDDADVSRSMTDLVKDEHASYYGLEGRSRKGLNADDQDWIHDAITIPKIAVGANAGSIGFQPIRWNGWASCNGNALLWSTAPYDHDYPFPLLLLIAVGRRHGIPWQFLPKELLRNIQVLATSDLNALPNMSPSDYPSHQRWEEFHSMWVIAPGHGHVRHVYPGPGISGATWWIHSQRPDLAPGLVNPNSR